MFALLLTAFILHCDDPIVVDADVEIILLPKFKMPLEILPSVQQELECVKIYVSRDDGKTWTLHNTVKPTEDEIVFSTTREGMVWFTIQFVYKNGKKEPKESSEFNPHRKVYISLTEREVKKRDDLLEEIKELKQTVNSLQRKIEALEIKNPNRERLSASLQSQLTQLEKDYGIQVILDKSDFPAGHPGTYIVNGEAATPPDIERFLPSFIDEWRRYPTSLCQKANLKKIIICQKLECRHVPYGGLADVRNNAIFCTIITDRPDLGDEGTAFYERRTLHHELFHFLDERMRTDIYHDPDWTELNPPEFRYGNSRAGRSTNVTNRDPGFITPYAQSAVEEDKAETYALMLSNLYEMECRAKDDEILAKKMARIKKVLEGFSPEFNEAFWNKVRYLDRPRLTLIGYKDPWADAHPRLPPLPKPAEVTVTEKSEYVLVSESENLRLFFHRRRCR